MDSFGHSSSSWDSFNDAPPLPPPREGDGRYSSLSQSPLLQNVPKTSPPETPPPAPRRQQQQQPQYEDVPNVYCEVVIPSSNKKGRPELVKSRSESSVNKLMSKSGSFNRLWRKGWIRCLAIAIGKVMCSYIPHEGRKIKLLQQQQQQQQQQRKTKQGTVQLLNRAMHGYCACYSEQL